MKKRIINIYITPLEQKRLNEYKEKYKISYSTIANIVLEKISLVMPLQQIEQIQPKLEGKKTSIKPKKQYDIGTTFSLSKLYTNCLKIFLNKELNKYVDNKKATKVYNYITQDMQETYEPNYNGNYLNRIMPKIVKANREYYKRILEE